LSLNALSNSQNALRTNVQSDSLIQTNVSALQEGLELLALLTPVQYTQGYKPAFHSTIGAHFRHVLEHYRCFVYQLPNREICYDSRERDLELECDFHYAEKTIHSLIADLQQLASLDLDVNCTLVDQQASEAVATTVYRELLFLQSHTMHHYAIIGAMTRSFGAQPADDFGVAIATRTHQQCGDATNIKPTVESN